MLKTNYILIDYENVQVKSLDLVKGEHFHVFVFLGAKNTKLPVELVLAMKALGNRGDYIAIETSGANALDFHIAFYLGFLVTTDPTGFFHIISNDTGFDPLIKYLKANKVLAARSVSIEDMPCFAKSSTTESVPNNGTGDGVGKKKQNNAVANLAIDQLINIVLEDLAKRKASKPSTSQALINTIRSKLGKDITIADVDKVFHELIKRGYVLVDAVGNKISYELPM